MKPSRILCVAWLCTAACGSSTQAGTASQQAGEASGSVTVVPFERLTPFLPDLAGWTRGQVNGETDTAEGVSRVQADYDKKPSRLSFQIMDSSKNPNVLAILTDAIKASRTETRPDGFTRPTTIEGFPGTEEWTGGPDSNNGEVSLLVGGRYIVGVSGNFVPNLATITDAAKQIGLKRLAALK